ncbi:DUF4252 domain-containing protein [Gilvibacter sediminis]|uniref:DUF4252 domain-containing protein n=1 Tax=Gilvibacter sediminis TaxID=379071 RepID=UPI002350E484|nr:DUF4252 domain-containing protein [Gilvibacter sediminis]MDC7999062.1 DUF4252 domain-containing protein [Gilvibacter sediminis]
MKRVIILVMAFVVTATGFAQDVFDKYETNGKVTSFVATAKMFKLIRDIDFETDDPEAQAYKDLIDNIDNIRVFVTEDEATRNDMNTTVTNYLKSNSKLEELMRVSSDGKRVRFYSQDGESEGFVKELLMHVTGDIDGKQMSVIMSLTGDLNLSQISQLTKDLKLPGSEELKNIDNKN